MATAQVTEDRLFTDALSYTLSRVGLSSIVLNQEQLTAIHCFYQRKNVFLWLPTGFGKLVCYEVLLFLFDFAEIFFDGLNCCKACTRTVANRCHPRLAPTVADQVTWEGLPSAVPFQLNNEDDGFGDTSDEQTLHVQSLTKAALIAVR